MFKSVISLAVGNLKTRLLPQTLYNSVSGYAYSRPCSFHSFNRCTRRRPDSLLVSKQSWSEQRITLLSGYFLKLDEPIQTGEESLLKQDLRYELKRNQNFGPVAVQDSNLPSGHYNLTSWDYSKREHLTYGGISYHELPVAFIRAKYNNTFIDIQTHDGIKRYSHVTCGLVGFKNVAKKTEHAAESVGKEAAERAVLLGCHEYVRVKIKGPGYGRAAAMRGLVMGGLKIASVSDITPLHVDGIPQRARKVRRI